LFASRVLSSHELEKICKDKTRKCGAPRFLYEGEIGYLAQLSGRHGKDVEVMAQDRKLNPDQRMVGELKRLIEGSREGRSGGGRGNLGNGLDAPYQTIHSIQLWIFRWGLARAREWVGPISGRGRFLHTPASRTPGGPSASLLSSPSFPSQIQCPGPLAVISHVHFFIFEG